MDNFLKNVHLKSFKNKKEILRSKKCAYFFCLTIHTPDKITEWIDENNDTAICPYCGIDSVLGDACGYSLNENLVKSMNSKWFPNLLFKKGEKVMKTTLPISGQKIQLGVSHTMDADPHTSIHSMNTTEPINMFRSTHVRLTLEDGTDFESRAICFPPDQFNKHEGRRRAVNRLLANIRNIVSDKEDRKTIFTMVCPEYRKFGPRNKRRNNE